MNWSAQEPDFFADRYYKGMQLAYPERVYRLTGGKNAAVLASRAFSEDRTAIIISGGCASGPLFPGYVGEGMADAAVGGSPYGAPSAYELYETGKYMGRSKGVFLLYNNFAGDFLNNDMAQELLEMEDISCRSFAVTDDIASAAGEPVSERSGRCGIALMIKLASACSLAGMSPDEILEMIRYANSRLATLSVKVDFEKHRVIYGNGFSGEPGIRQEDHLSMERLAGEAADMILQELKPRSDEKLIVLVNRLQQTCYADGFIMGQLLHQHITRHFQISQLRVANFSNILDIYGFNFSFMCIDKKLDAYMRHTVYGDSFIL